MHPDNIALRRLAGLSPGLDSKQFVTELRDGGFTREQAIEALCEAFGVPRGAARLFVVSHPAWGAKAPAREPDGPTSLSL